MRAGRAGAAVTLVLALAGCGGSSDARGPSMVTAAGSAQIATVLIVHWTTAVPTTRYVEFETAKQLGARTPVEQTAALEHTATVLGLPADTISYYRVVSAENGAAVAA